MTDYSKMTDSEIDRLAALMMGKTYFNYYCEYTRKGISGIEVQVCPTKDLFDWSPTKNAQQIQDYLFPRLLKRGFIPEPQYGYMEFQGDIYFNFAIRFGFKQIAHGFTRDTDQINRTTVIACLEAWEKALKAIENKEK